jgi:ribose 5-phosphate isomerase B
MRIAIGADHAGFRLKEHLREVLGTWGHDVLDLGAHSTESTDYPQFGAAVGRAVVQGHAELGVAVCGSGIGVAIAANKIAGVRAAVIAEPLSAKSSREHNDCNVLCLGERLIGTAMAEAVLDVFLSTPFAGGRHERRVDQILELEK